MIERYTLPQMGKVWSEESKLQNWLRIEIAACEGWALLGVIPGPVVENIKSRARFNLERVKEIEAEVHHDVIAFLTNVAEYVGEDSKNIHQGLTSSDILDTGIAMQMRDAADLILEKMAVLKEAIAQKALAYKYTPIIGRTHGVHGEPTTFGLKLAVWYTEMERNMERLRQAREVISYGAISGAVGNFAHLDPRVEEHVCKTLGLKPCEASTQIIQRDRHAHFMSILAVAGSSLEKMATEVRNLQRTDLLEVEEPFARGQKGSSAMPHKRNPMISERVAGLSRILRGNAVAALENVALWHERDLTHSSVERVIIPDSCILLDYMLHRFTGVIKELVVYPEHMAANIEKTRGLIFSQELMLALVHKGVLREEAYALVQNQALQSWNEKKDFKKLVQEDQKIRNYIKEEEIEHIFGQPLDRTKVDFIFHRCGLG